MRKTGFLKGTLSLAVCLVVLMLASNAGATLTDQKYAFNWFNYKDANNGLAWQDDYGWVQVTLTSSGADVTFQTEGTAMFWGDVGFNTDATSVYQGSTLLNSGVYHLDGAGDYMYGFDARNTGLTSITFSLTGSWTDAGDVLLSKDWAVGKMDYSSKGHWFAAHIKPDSGTTPTGYAAGNAEPYTTSNVPIPPSVFLLGSGLIGLVAVRRRIRKK